MKKKFYAFALAIIIALSMGVFGCANPAESNEPETHNDPSLRLISGFSSEAELRTFRYANYFNKAEINRDKQYVTQGSTSAKFHIAGRPALMWIPRFDIFTDTPYFAMADFTKVTMITADIFNTDTVSRTVKFSFTTRLMGAVRAQYTEKETELKPGKNQFSYVIEREIADKITYLNKVEYMTFTFELAETPYEIYMDNLVAHVTDEPIAELIKTYKDNEVLFFDDMSDRYYVTPSTIRGIPTQAPKLSTNRDARYTKDGSSGSLKVDLIVTASRANSDDFPGITIAGDPITRLDFSEYQAVKLSIMGSDTIRGNIYVEVVDANGLNYNNITHMREVVPWGTPIAGNVWHELTIDIGKLIDRGLDVENLEKLNLYYDNLKTGEPYTLFIDDIRTVK